MKITTAAMIVMACSLGAFSPMTASAQHENHSTKSAPSHASAAGKKAMPSDHMMMANEPHHVLAMAYHRNLAAFTRALQDRSERPGAINVEFTRSAVTEMRRSFDQMQLHHAAHMKTMSPEMHTSMNAMMQQMETHHAELNTQIAVLEREAQLTTPDAKIIASVAANIHTHLDAMEKLHRDGSGNKMKMKTKM